MFTRTIDATDLEPGTLRQTIHKELARLPIDAVVRLRVEGDLQPGSEEVIRAAGLRSLHPETMTVTIRFRPPMR
jgi:hypothetical protein